MKVLVCGGRDYGDLDHVFDVLDAVDDEVTITLLIHGDARGADRLAGKWAAHRSVPVKACPADWDKLEHRAGLVRNRQMLELKPDLVVAFPGGTGTADMVKIAKKAGIKVREEEARHPSRVSL